MPHEKIVRIHTDKIIFENMSVSFIDHIIVADGDFVSMRQDKMSKAFRE